MCNKKLAIGGQSVHLQSKLCHSNHWTLNKTSFHMLHYPYNMKKRIKHMKKPYPVPSTEQNDSLCVVKFWRRFRVPIFYFVCHLYTSIIDFYIKQLIICAWFLFRLCCCCFSQFLSTTERKKGTQSVDAFNSPQFFLKSHARKKCIQISMMYLLSIAAKHYCGNYVVSYVSPSLDGFRSGWDF